MPAAPIAVIYFDKSFEDMAKDVSARVRNDGGSSRLCWGSAFRGPGSLEGCSAAIIQLSLPNSGAIAQCYASFASSTEIHFLSDDGDFVNARGEIVELEEGNHTDAQSEVQPEPSGQEESADATVPDTEGTGDGPEASEDPDAA